MSCFASQRLIAFLFLRHAANASTIDNVAFLFVFRTQWTIISFMSPQWIYCVLSRSRQSVHCPKLFSRGEPDTERIYEDLHARADEDKDLIVLVEYLITKLLRSDPYSTRFAVDLFLAIEQEIQRCVWLYSSLKVSLHLCSRCTAMSRRCPTFLSTRQDYSVCSEQKIVEMRTLTCVIFVLLHSRIIQYMFDGLIMGLHCYSRTGSHQLIIKLQCFFWTLILNDVEFYCRVVKHCSIFGLIYFLWWTNLP